MIGWFLSLLENWIRKKDPAFVASLSNISTQTIIHKIQRYKLHQTIRYAYENSEFYRRTFRDVGLKPSDIRATTDLTKIPFTTPTDLQKEPDAFLAIPREKIVRVFTSGGTTGSPKKIFYTQTDMDHITDLAAVGLTMVGCTKRDTVQIMFSYGRPSWTGGTLAEMGGQKLGATVIASGDTLSTEEQIQTMKELGTTVLFGYPSYLHRVTEEARKTHDLTQLGIHSIFIGAAPWSESLRHYLQEAWNAKAYDDYGLTELAGVAGECKMQNGLHVNELDFLLEIVDPSTGEHVSPGEHGEIVVTTLNREGMPLLRYRTRDISYMIEEKCGCGINTSRIGRIKGRTDAMIIVGTGENIFPYMFDEAFLNLDGVLDYQIVLEKTGFQDEITVRAEVSQHTIRMKKNVLNALTQVSPISRDVEVTKTIAKPKIELVEPGTLKKSSETKVRKIIDKRKP